MTRPTITGMSRIAFSRVGTRQLRGENRPPPDVGGAVGAGPGTGAGAAPRGGGVKLPRADGSGPFLLRLTRPTTSRRGRHLRCAAVSQSPVRHRLVSTSLTIGQFRDRKSTRLNSSHMSISYAVF